MRMQAIIHQHICQLRWHLVACLGLIMVLPIEEAVVSFRAGQGFYSVGLAVVAVSFGPLLAGLIACANVQGDLSEKLYIFWRSKPASVKKLIALKFVVGLILSLAMIGCPLIFAVVTAALCGENLDWQTFKYYVPIPIVVAVMTYSLCFGCNVLVRNTARSWLVGMFLAGLVLVIPFVLPLGFTDIVSDVGMWALGFYPAIILVASVAAFVLALFAAHHDWHVKTNIKGLMCAGAGLVLVVLFLFSNQVANMRVLHETYAGYAGRGRGTLDEARESLLLGGRSYVDVGKKGIALHPVGSRGNEPVDYPVNRSCGVDSEENEVIYGPTSRFDSCRSYPDYPNNLFYMDEGGNICYFAITAYSRREGEGRQGKDIYERAYLTSFRLIGVSWEGIDELDISDFIGGRVNHIRMAIRLVDNTLIACVNNSYVVVDVTNPQQLTEIARKVDVLPGGTVWLEQEDRRKEISIPLIPFEGISEEERIRLSIDLRYRYQYDDNNIYDSSIAAIDDGKIAFFCASQRDIARFGVIGCEGRSESVAPGGPKL